MNYDAFAEVINARACARSFEDTVLDLAEIQDVLKLASRAPSSKNTQPWGAVLVRGDALEQLRKAYVQAFAEGVKPVPDYEYSIEPQPDLWKARARQVGFGLFAHKGIGREDKDKMQAHYQANYEFFGAPQVLFVTTRKDAGLGNFMDTGMFLGNVLAAITAKGWAACPSMSAVHYPHLLRQIIPGHADLNFLCGVPFGIATDEHVNQYRTLRADLAEWFTVIE